MAPVSVNAIKAAASAERQCASGGATLQLVKLRHTIVILSGTYWQSGKIVLSYHESECAARIRGA